jgi:hypothetical protein
MPPQPASDISDPVSPDASEPSAPAKKRRAKKPASTAQRPARTSAAKEDLAANDNHAPPADVIMLSQLPPAVSLAPIVLPPLPQLDAPAEPSRMALEDLLGADLARDMEGAAPEGSDPPTAVFARHSALPELGAPSAYPGAAIPIEALPLPDEIELQRVTPLPRPSTDFPAPPPSPALAAMESDAQHEDHVAPESPAPAAESPVTAPSVVVFSSRKVLIARIAAHTVATILCALLGARLGGWGRHHPAPPPAAASADSHGAHDDHDAHDEHGAHDDHGASAPPATDADGGAPAAPARHGEDDAVTLSANVAATRAILAAYGVARRPEPPPVVHPDAGVAQVQRAARPARARVIPPNPYVFGRVGAAQILNLDMAPPPPQDPPAPEH